MSSSRSGGGSRGSGGNASATSNAAASLGSADVGSTGAALDFGGGGSSGGRGGGGGGGGPGGGGGNDFMMVIQQLAKPGSFVKKGDVVAEFDRQFALLRLDDYKATVVTNESGFKSLKAQLDVSRDAHEQLIRVAKNEVDKAALDLKTLPVRSAIETERLRLAYEEAQARHKQLLSEVKYVRIGEEAQVKNAELEVEQTRLELKRAEANAERLLARTPIDGLVVMQNTFRGTEFSQIQQGDQLFPGQLYMQIVNPSSMVINATINQVDVDLLRIGAKALVRFDAYPDLELPGRIISIGAITRTGGFRPTYFKEVPVRLKLDKMDPRVIPDLSVSCDVLLESEPETVVVPREGIFSENGKSFVFIQTPSGFERRPVELGLTSHTAAAVKSGVKPGEVVALEKPPDRSPGEPSKRI